MALRVVRQIVIPPRGSVLDRIIQTNLDAAVSTGADTPPANVMVASGRVAYDFVGRAVKQHFPITEPRGPANTTLNETFDAVAPTGTVVRRTGPGDQGRPTG